MPQPAPAPDFPLERINAAFKQTRMIVLAIAASLPVYVLVAELTSRSMPAATVPAPTALRYTFFGVAVLFIFTATIIKSALLRSVPLTPEARLARLRVASIVTAAFAEGPAVLGLALFMITRSRGDFYILLVVAAYLLVRHLPQQAAWELYVGRGGDAR
jgi:hypothetical protein